MVDMPAITYQPTKQSTLLEKILKYYRLDLFK